MLEILIEGTSCFIHEINVAKLLSLEANMKPTNFWANMRILDE